MYIQYSQPTSLRKELDVNNTYLTGIYYCFILDYD